MSIVFFNSVLTTLGKRVNYDAVVNYAGNSFAKDAWKTIQEANPLVKQKKKHAFDDMFNSIAMPKTKTVPKELAKSDNWIGTKDSDSVDVTDTGKDIFAALSAAVNR